MKVTVEAYKNPDKGIVNHKIGTVVTCDSYPDGAYLVIETEWLSGYGGKTLVNLTNGGTASQEWAAGHTWYVREAVLTVK